jgi:hypothetical protein
MSRKMVGFSRCPECGLRIHDPTLARLGFCSVCEAFTGMCAAGRKIICPDVMTVTSWHTACTNLGTVSWEITQEGRTFAARLCSEHDAQVREGKMPWIAAAAPLTRAPAPLVRARRLQSLPSLRRRGRVR